MSRLHAVRTTVAEIARTFDAEAASGLVVPNETIEGLPGLVVIEGKDRRLVRPATWGFPRPSLERAIRGEEPQRVGMVADLTNPMWKQVVVDPRYRCLIPITHFANPDGVPGAKTRTWFSVKDRPIVAWAGFCRNLLDVGPVYAGMTMDANEAIPSTNDRMPVLLDPEDHDTWLHGSIQDVIRSMYRPPFAADRLRIERTDDAWQSGVAPPGTGQQGKLL